jgi:putative spermidine/putrescine transport system substrate-binding protein
MNVREVIPSEGVTGWSDSWMVAKNAAHPVCAYKWLNYATSPAVQAKVAAVTAYSPANSLTCGVVGPAKCKSLHITDSRYYSSIHYWITPTAPTNLQQWNDAWAQVKG